VEDVSKLEQYILREGPVPISQLHQHLLKYIIAYYSKYGATEEEITSAITKSILELQRENA
jgi:hypothetical protein